VGRIFENRGFYERINIGDALSDGVLVQPVQRQGAPSLGAGPKK
jgi:hypothetical protein